MDKAVQELQDELNLLKNEIKETLTDIREHLLTYVENPFQAAPPPAAVQSSQAPGPQPLSNTTSIQMGSASDGSEKNGANGSPTAIGTQEAPTGPTPLPSEPVSQGTQPDRTASSAQVPPKASANGKASASQLPEAPGMNGKAALTEDPGTQDELDESNEKETAVEPQELQPRAGKLVSGREGATMFKLATLAPWLEDGIARLGKERIKSVIEVYATMGGLSDQLKDVLTRLISLDGAEAAPTRVSLRDCLRSLAELDSLLWRSRVDPTGAAVQAVLLNGRESGRGSWDDVAWQHETNK